MKAVQTSNAYPGWGQPTGGALAESCAIYPVNFRTCTDLNPIKIKIYLRAHLAANVFDRRSQSIVDIKEAVKDFANPIEPKWSIFFKKQ